MGEMTQEFPNPQSETVDGEPGSALPFPFNQQNYCRFEPIEQRIDEARVLVVDNLLRNEEDLSVVGRREFGETVEDQLKRERHIADLAIENILNNISRLVKRPSTQVVHVSEIAQATESFRPDAIVLSGTLRDFDYYDQTILDNFREFICKTRIPVLGICGGHQLVGLSFGARVVTLDKLEQHEQRQDRPQEYQYRFIRITDVNDPIFDGIQCEEASVDSSISKKASILRVWQNHGLQLDRVPNGFQLLATSYLCRNQMMVKRNEGQLIYTVQFHLEKSFEDWNKSRTRWEHPNESRDGRLLFENFLMLALKKD
jgi:GMP synthase (glutamine-hydrolysing)